MTHELCISLPGREVKRCSGSLQFQQNPAGDCDVAQALAYTVVSFLGPFLPKEKSTMSLDILDYSIL